jgi:glutathione S-transferase
MMLIGQYDSPFVRRVAIALTLYEMPFEHADWTGFGDVDKIARYSPMRRVPALVLDDGVVLADSAAILDWLDELAGDDTALIASSGLDRREALRIIGLASGAADKGVSLVYEGAFRSEASDPWVNRCRSQVTGALDALEAARLDRKTPWLFGDRLGHADIMVACMLRFIREALPGQFEMDAWPALAAHAAACEALSVFQSISRPFSLAPPSAD